MADPSHPAVDRDHQPDDAAHRPAAGRASPAGDARVRLALAAVLVVCRRAGPAARLGWARYRRAHSLTDDAFVEAHIINIAPQMVSGRIVRFLVDENDRVEPGQVLAEIDPTPYRDKVALARTQAGGGPGRPGPPEGRPRARPQGGADPGRDRPADAGRRDDRPGQGRGGPEADPGRGREGDRGGPRGRQGGEGEPRRSPSRNTAASRGSTQQGASTQERQQQVTQSRDAAQAAGRAGRGQAGQGPGLADPDRHRPALARVGADGRPRRPPRASTSRRSATTRSTRSNCWSGSRS